MTTHIAIIGGGRVGAAIEAVTARLGGYRAMVIDRADVPYCAQRMNSETELFISDDTEKILSALNRFFSKTPAKKCAVVFALSHVQAYPLLIPLDQRLSQGIRFLVVGRPADVDPAVFTRRPIHFGAGLEPGLAEALLQVLHKKMVMPDCIETYCGGLPHIPSAPAWHEMNFATESAFTNRTSLARINGCEVKRPRFDTRDQVFFPDFGVLECYDDALLPETLSEPSLSTVPTLHQRTLRWPGFAAFALSDLSPNEKTAAVTPRGEDVVLLAARAQKDHRQFEIIVRTDPCSGFSAMAWATALGSIAALVAGMSIEHQARCIFPAADRNDSVFYSFKDIVQQFGPDGSGTSICWTGSHQTQRILEEDSCHD
ncbi:hypothetical protein NA8A_20677 [Nitratireductor indicus C115]|uniref:Saccharopine dehydrogenase n=1 Tax=Nitratireductor indicus C115 TaxID=1231190 RepID=K2MZC1_9HYPH|nr:hypothetical protein [Nitratireductor indicus]EKF40578.1 hypothetical protein NA8A_20677 [Nitratireductor indicus C115]SFQ48894.1 hypothetical protein SAMN05216176_104255 [Nitratireductor indicus]